MGFVRPARQKFSTMWPSTTFEFETPVLCRAYKYVKKPLTYGSGREEWISYDIFFQDNSYFKMMLNSYTLSS